MVADYDPYKVPNADLEGARENRSTGLEITQGMIGALNKTRPWVIFLAILGFIGAGFMVLGGLGLAGAGIIGASVGNGPEPMPIAASLGLAALYILLAVLYVVPCLSLVRYGMAIGRIKVAGGPAFEEALHNQMRFWRVMGIMTLVVMGLYILFFIGTIVVMVVLGASSAL